MASAGGDTSVPLCEEVCAGFRPWEEVEGYSADQIGKFPVLLRDEELLTVMRPTAAPGFDVAREAEAMFADEWGPGNPFIDKLIFEGCTGIEPGPWLMRDPVPDACCGEVPPRHGMRVVRLRAPVPPVPLAPKTTAAVLTYWITYKQKPEGPSLIVDNSVVCLETPYCDYFHVHEHWAWAGTKGGAELSKGFGLIFCKSTLAKWMIQMHAVATQKKASEGVLKFLQDRGQEVEKAHDHVSSGSTHASYGSDGFSDPPPLLTDRSLPSACDKLSTSGTISTVDSVEGNARSPSPRDSPTSPGVTRKITVEAWELQRRYTVFHSSWEAPFMPHDGEKRWRWVEDGYVRHFLVAEYGERSTRAAVAAADLPDLVLPPPMGWRAKGSWKVTSPPAGEADTDGWQYAAGFSDSDASWGAHSDWMLCRRRRWQCVLEAMHDSVSDAVDVQEFFVPASARRGAPTGPRGLFTCCAAA